MKTSLIAIDGVMRKLVGNSPIPEGMRLYRAMAATGQVVVMAYEHDHDQSEDWLQLNGCVNHAFIAWHDGTVVGTANRLRREGYDIDLIVVPDPAEAIELINSGHTTLLFTHARYAQPSWRPDADQGVKSWDAIVADVARMAKMKAADARLGKDDD